MTEEKLKPTCHKLKIHPTYYVDIKAGRKSFEIRKNDRDFKVGDELELLEYVEGHYTHANPIYGRIVYITDYEQKPGMVVLGIDWYVSLCD